MKLSTMGVGLSSLVLLTGLVLLPGCGDENKASKDSASEKKADKKDKKDKKDKDAKKEEGDAKPASAKPEKDKKAEPKDAKAEGESKDGDAKDADAKVDSGTPTCGELKDVPAIPSTTSKPPTVEEWEKACKVNTQGPNSHPDDCEMKVLREWLRVTCRGDYYKTQNMENFGAVGVDYFEMIKPNQLISYTMKLTKGRNQKIRMCHTKKKRASLFVSWPQAEEKPLHIALARGPACD